MRLWVIQILNGVEIYEGKKFVRDENLQAFPVNSKFRYGFSNELLIEDWLWTTQSANLPVENQEYVQKHKTWKTQKSRGLSVLNSRMRSKACICLKCNTTSIWKTCNVKGLTALQFPSSFSWVKDAKQMYTTLTTMQWMLTSKYMHWRMKNSMM